MEHTQDNRSWKHAFLDLVYGIPSREMLQSMTDKELMDQINYDAEDGRINTPYAAEYQHRQVLRSRGEDVPLLPKYANPLVELACCIGVLAACVAIAFWMKG